MSSIILSFLALIISIISLYFSYSSRNEARRSADAAEKARKIAQADFFKPHFRNVEHFLNALSGDKTSGDNTTNGPKLDSVGPSISLLQSTLGHDDGMREILEKLKETLAIDDVTRVIKIYRKDSDSVSLVNQAPDNLEQIQDAFYELRGRYMRIE